MVIIQCQGNWTMVIIQCPWNWTMVIIQCQQNWAMVIIQCQWNSTMVIIHGYIEKNMVINQCWENIYGTYSVLNKKRNSIWSVSRKSMELNHGLIQKR